VAPIIHRSESLCFYCSRPIAKFVDDVPMTKSTSESPLCTKRIFMYRIGNIAVALTSSAMPECADVKFVSYPRRSTGTSAGIANR